MKKGVGDYGEGECGSLVTLRYQPEHSILHSGVTGQRLGFDPAVSQRLGFDPATFDPAFRGQESGGKVQGCVAQQWGEALFVKRVANQT